MGAYGPPPGFYRSKPRIRIDAMRCIGCMRCLAACPQNEVISAGRVNGRAYAYVKDIDRCAGCASCVDACITNAILLYMT